MEGVVKIVNEERGLFAVETNNGFTVYEFDVTDHIETGDVVSGALESSACDNLHNHSRDVGLVVNTHDIVPTLEAAEALVHSD